MKRFVMVLGIILLLLGIVAVIHPTFDYHSKEEVAKVGPFHATVDEEKTAKIPVAATVALIVAGLVLVLGGSRMKP
jgi:uncharacterized membrane protein HdeD (DUF308 family)